VSDVLADTGIPYQPIYYSIIKHPPFGRVNPLRTAGPVEEVTGMSREMNEKSVLEISGSEKIDVRISQSWALRALAWARIMIAGLRRWCPSYTTPYTERVDLALGSAGRV